MTRFTVTGDAGGAVKAVNDLVKAIAKGDEAFEKTTKKATALDKAAQQIVKNNEGPQEKYNRRIKELADLVNKGKLSFEQADIAARRYSDQLNKAGDAGKFAFGPAMLSNLASMAAGMASLGTAIRLVTGYFSEMEERGTKAAQSTRSSLADIGALQQLGNSPEQLALMRRVMMDAGIADEGQAAKIAFAFNSNAVAGKDRDFVLQAFRGRLLDPAQGDTVVQMLSKAKNALGTSSIETTADELQALSSLASASMAEVGAAVLDYANFAAASGFNRYEALAVFKPLEDEAKSAPVAGTQAKALFNEIFDKNLRRGSLQETLQSLSASDLSSGESRLALLAFQKHPERYQSALSDLMAADASNLATREMNSAAADPMFGAALRAAHAQAAAAVMASKYGVQENLIDAINADRDAITAKSGNEAARFLRGRITGLLDYFNQDESMIRGAAYDESLPAETRLQAARYLRQNFEPGMFQTQGSIDAVTQRLDAMIANLEQMVRASNTQANGVTTRQE